MADNKQKLGDGKPGKLGVDLRGAAANAVKAHVLAHVFAAIIPVIVVVVVFGGAAWAMSGTSTSSSTAGTTSDTSKTRVSASGCHITGSSSATIKCDSSTSGSDKGSSDGSSSNSSSVTGAQSYADANDKQKAVADAAKNGEGSQQAGRCMAFVDDVYEAAGYSVGRQRCPRDCLDSMSFHTSDLSNIKVGMVVLTKEWSGGSRDENGVSYGHIGIYVGDGQVVHNVGGIKTCSLDEWVSTFGDVAGVECGWIGEDLSQ